jgi:hypothetical protein
VPAEEDARKASAVKLKPDDPCGNAARVQQALGWTIIKGFVVYDLAAQPEGEQFVAHLRWWNAKESGVWVDFTPRLPGHDQMVLLESSKAEDKSLLPLTAQRKAAAEARRKLGGFVAAPAPAPAPATKKKPPPAPAKLDFKGTESLAEFIKLLSAGTSDAKAKAAAAVAAHAALGGDESKAVVAAGGVPPLLLLLGSKGDAQEHAARALMALADRAEHQSVLTAAGIIPAAVGLLRDAPVAAQDAAAGILGNLAIQCPVNQRAVVAAGALPHLVALLSKGPAPAKEQACFAIWNLACQHPANMLAIEEAGAIRPLVALLSKGTPAVQEEAAGALMNLAAHPDNKRAIAAASAIEALVALLEQVKANGAGRGGRYFRGKGNGRGGGYYAGSGARAPLV